MPYSPEEVCKIGKIEMVWMNINKDEDNSPSKSLNDSEVSLVFFFCFFFNDAGGYVLQEGEWEWEIVMIEV